MTASDRNRDGAGRRPRKATANDAAAERQRARERAAEEALPRKVGPPKRAGGR